MEGATQQYDTYVWQVQRAPKENSASSLLYKLAMPDDQFMFSSSSLLRPRFELRALTGWDPGPVWTGVENLAPTGIRSPNLQPEACR